MSGTDLEFIESELIEKIETASCDTADWLKNPKWEGSRTIQDHYEKSKYETYFSSPWMPVVSVIYDTDFEDKILLHVDMKVGAWTGLFPINEFGIKALRFAYEMIGDGINFGWFSDPGTCKEGMEALHMEYQAY